MNELEELRARIGTLEAERGGLLKILQALPEQQRRLTELLNLQSQLMEGLSKQVVGLTRRLAGFETLLTELSRSQPSSKS